MMEIPLLLVGTPVTPCGNGGRISYIGLSAMNTTGAVSSWKRAALLRIAFDIDADRVNRALRKDAEKRDRDVEGHQWTENLAGGIGKKGQNGLIPREPRSLGRLHSQHW